MTTTPRLLASLWNASVVSPGTLSARPKLPWSSLWQKYCERKSSCVQMMLAPRFAASSAIASAVLRFAAGSAVQACWRRPRTTLPISIDDLVEGILDDALGPERLEPRQDLPDDALVYDRLQGDPVRVAERRHRRVAQRRDRGQDRRAGLLRGVHLQAHLRLRLEGPPDHERDRLDLPALHRVRPGPLVGDQLRVGLQERVHDAQLVRAQGRARLRDV